MPIRTAEAEWRGDLIEGNGNLSVASGAFSGPYDWRSRSADGPNTNPEELIGAAHAGCFSMAFSHGLATAGFPPTRVHTTARVHLEKVEGGFAIPKIELETEAEVPGISPDKFQELAEGAKAGCPVSKALAGPEITLRATLL
jgi:lipoyl-dependent peroxiredoxin